MTPQTVLDTLTGTGIRIELENGNLRYHSHKLLDDELIIEPFILKQSAGQRSYRTL